MKYVTAYIGVAVLVFGLTQTTNAQNRVPNHLAERERLVDLINELVAERRQVGTLWGTLITSQATFDSPDVEPLNTIDETLGSTVNFGLWLDDLLHLGGSNEPIAWRCDLFLNTTPGEELLLRALQQIESPGNALVAKKAIGVWRETLDVMEEICQKRGYTAE